MIEHDYMTIPREQYAELIRKATILDLLLSIRKDQYLPSDMAAVMDSIDHAPATTQEVTE